jgi:hypothetical protein
LINSRYTVERSVASGASTGNKKPVTKMQNGFETFDRGLMDWKG